MAIVLNNPFGEMSGAFVGGVFVQRSQQQIYKARRHPFRSKSINNINSKNTFRGSGNTWSVFEEANRDAWNTFAYESYRPLRNFRPLLYSGWNAFKGFSVAAHTANEKIGGGVWEAYPVVAGNFANSSFFSQPYNPPNENIQSSVADQSFNEYPLKIDEDYFELTKIGEFRLRLIYDGMGGANYDYIQLQDVFGNEFNFCFYLSNPLRAEGEIVGNKFYRNVYSSGVLNWVNDGCLNSSGVQCEGDFNTNLQRWSTTLQVGQWYLLTVVAIGDTGSVCQCDSKYIQVQEDLS